MQYQCEVDQVEPAKKEKKSECHEDSCWLHITVKLLKSAIFLILKILQLKAGDRQLMLKNTMDWWQEHNKQRAMLCSAAHVFIESADS